MNWKAFKRHFQAAAEPEPAPFGPDAIEWDYSRYSRALGLTTQPGLHDLPYTAFAMMATQPKYWERARERQERWASELGWRSLRISARPTVAVPDPVVWALGHSAAGDDGLMFVRSGRGGRPYVGKRRRPAGCSIALTPGERWLIAGERVRRRFRAALAVQGHAIFIEEAEYLTPAAINLLAYLGNAHRAWRARMVVSSAPLHILLATTPEYEIPVRRALDRADVKGDVVVLREPEPGSAEASKRDPLPEPMTVEEEHLVAALQAAPIALAEADLPGIFGSSVKAAVARLMDRGVLLRRTEDATACVLVASPAPPLPEPPDRVIEALAAYYRERLRQGRCHEHLAPAAALLRFRLEDRGRAVALFGRTPAANFATVPLCVADALDRHLDEAAPPPRCDVLAGRLALRAHFHDYESAQRHARDITSTPIRTEPELARLLCCLVGLGNLNRSASLPRDFWPGINAPNLDPGLLDSTAILAETYFRIRDLDIREIVDRVGAVASSLAEARLNQGPFLRRVGRVRPSLSDLALGLYARLRVRAAGQSGRQLSDSRVSSKVPCDMAELVGLPAMLLNSYHYTMAAWGVNRTPSVQSRAWAYGLLGASADPRDLRIQQTSWLVWLHGKCLHLLSRCVADDALLCHARAVPKGMHMGLQAALQPLAGRRNWLPSAKRLYFTSRTTEGRELVRRTFATAEVAFRLMSEGEYAASIAAAWAAVRQGSASPAHSVLAVVRLVQVLRNTLHWDELSQCESLVRGQASSVRASLGEFLREYYFGSRFLVRGDWVRARDAFAAAGRSLRGEISAVTRALFSVAQYDRSQCNRTTLRLANTPDGRATLRLGQLCAEFLAADEASSARFEAPRLESSLDYLVLVLEAWARHSERDTSESILPVVSEMMSAGDRELNSIGHGVTEALSRWAPTAYALLEGELEGCLGARIHQLSSPSHLRSAIRMMNASGPAIKRRSAPPRDGENRAVADRRADASSGRAESARARADGRVWRDDPAIYRLCRNWLRIQPTESSERLRVRAYGWHNGEDDGAVGMEYVFERTNSRSPTDARLSMSDWAPTQGSTTAKNQACRNEQREQAAGGGDRVDCRTSNVREFEGSSPESEEVRRMARSAAKCGYPVLLIGETGTGKEVVANTIHRLSAEAGMDLVVMNCACVPEHLLESELFGHERGAFTGACSKRVGLIEQADRSTLFLDEVDSMPRRMQAALLRVLESGEFRRVGGSKMGVSGFRVIAAAQPKLLSEVESGRFRPDLYYRLSTIWIRIPPLRERPQDVIQIGRRLAKERGLQVAPDAWRHMEDYSWPGNVRELRNLFDACKAMVGPRVLGPAELESVLRQRSAGVSSEYSPQTGLDAATEAWARAGGGERFYEWFCARDFAAATGVSRRTAQRFLAKLCGQGLVARDGAGRGTRYRRASRARK